MNLTTQVKIINDEVAGAKIKLTQFQSFVDIKFKDMDEDQKTILSLVTQALEHLETASKALFNEE